MVFLTEITLYNFKSFKGRCKLENILPFTAIVGCNGAGKSNLMEAVSFAMGVKVGNLRVSKMEDLVHKSGRETHRGDAMSVTVVLRSSQGTETRFKRSFTKGACQCLINDKVVSHTDYLEVLAKLDIISKIMNFGVAQSCIEAIVTKSPLERTAMLEAICGSGSLAGKYKRLNSEMLQWKEKLRFLQQTKRSLMAEIKNISYCREKAHEYKALMKRLTTEQLNLTLFNLFYIERNISVWNETLKDKSNKIHALEVEMAALNESLESLRRVHEDHKHTAARIESEIKIMEKELVNKVNELARVESKVEHSKKRVEECKMSLVSAREVDEAREKTIKELEALLETNEEKKRQYVRRFSKTMARQIQLSDSQEDEYEYKKAMCYVTFAKQHRKLMFLERERDGIQDEFDKVMRKRELNQIAVDRKIVLHRGCTTRHRNLKEFLRKINSRLEASRNYQQELMVTSKSLKEKENALIEKLEVVGKQIEDSEAKEEAMSKREIENNLRRLFAGVMDRLKNMCSPIHERYDTAMAAVIDRQIDSIVVDTSENALRCIEYLKTILQNRIETFLPVDSVKAMPLNQQLRNIVNPPNVKLIYDVIDCDSSIERVLRFVTGDTLVCEVPEHAAKIAFAPRKNNRHDCISVDGTFYSKSGLISRGWRDRPTRVQRRDSCADTSLYDRCISSKADLIQSLQETRSSYPNESQFEIVQATISHLEKFLKLASSDYDHNSKEAVSMEFELLELEDELDTSSRSMDNVEMKLQQITEKINQLMAKINRKENEFFHKFCEEIGVEDIREYEESQRSYKETITSFDREINRINEQLEFERIRETRKSVSRWEQCLEKAELELKSSLAKESLTRSYIDERRKYVEEAEKLYKSVKEEPKEMLEIKEKIKGISKELYALEKQMRGFQTLIEKKKAQRHAILTDAKVLSIEIPLLQRPGNDSSSARDATNERDSTDESAELYEREGEVQYDFSKLSRNLRELDDSAEIRKAREKLRKSVSDVEAAMEAMEPNMNASQQLEYLKDKLADTKFQIERVTKEAHKVNVEFERVKMDRYLKFFKFFERVSEQTDMIYKKLTKNQGAQAYLMPENPEEPYLGGVHYNCIAPDKRFQSMRNLSGGEKALAALPLIFAAYSGDSPPFKVLDEIDAALDRKNTSKVVSFIRENRENQQVIVISHKRELFVGADALIGIDTVITEDGCESKIVTLDLRQYQP